MRTMKFKFLCASLGTSLFIAPSLFAQLVNTGNIGTGSLSITAPSFSKNGDQAGPYLVQNLTVGSGVAPVSTTFQTFCIGSQVDYYPGNVYGYQISEIVQPANVGAPGYVTWGTAYLYSQFLAGAPGIGAGGNSTSVTVDNAYNDALQVAIWILQGQRYDNVTYNGPVDMSLVDGYLTDAANAASLDGISSDSNNADGAFGIYALNMYSGCNYVQPELVQVPVPEPTTVLAGASLLIPFGFSTFRLLRNARKRRETTVKRLD